MEGRNQGGDLNFLWNLPHTNQLLSVRVQKWTDCTMKTLSSIGPGMVMAFWFYFSSFKSLLL